MKNEPVLYRFQSLPELTAQEINARSKRLRLDDARLRWKAIRRIRSLMRELSDCSLQLLKWNRKR
jgi:hypothetical protein